MIPLRGYPEDTVGLNGQEEAGQTSSPDVAQWSDASGHNVWLQDRIGDSNAADNPASSYEAMSRLHEALFVDSPAMTRESQTLDSACDEFSARIG